MPARAVTQFEPRKKPVQARAAVTVGAISEATIQVLLEQGVSRLTTTRVAERAGVSVGTLYQYYPNKQSLLFAVLAEHFERIGSAVEAACDQARGKPVEDGLIELLARALDGRAGALLQIVDAPVVDRDPDDRAVE